VIGYPTNRLLAVFDDPALEARVRSELTAIGVPADDIHVLSGDEAAAGDGTLRRRIVEVLRSLGARFVNYGRLETEELIPWAERER